MSRRLLHFVFASLIALQSVAAVGASELRLDSTPDCEGHMALDAMESTGATVASDNSQSSSADSDCCSDSCPTMTHCSVATVYSASDPSPIRFGFGSTIEITAFIAQLKLAPEYTPLNPPPIA